MPDNTDLQNSAFWNAFKGSFSGILKWSDVDALFESLHENPANWHVFDMGRIPVDNDPPTSPLEAQDFDTFLQDAKKLIRKHQSRPSCGAIYVDNPANPSFIKIFDPMKMGTSCGTSTEPVLPRWTITRMRPDAVPLPPPAAKPGFFARLVGAAHPG